MEPIRKNPYKLPKKAKVDPNRGYPGEWCGWCGTLIGKDYGSFSHRCAKMDQADKYYREEKNIEIETLTEYFKTTENPVIEFEVMEGNKVIGTVMVPVEPKIMWRDVQFTAPNTIEINGKLYSNGSRYFTVAGYGRQYRLIEPEEKLEMST